MPVHQHSSPNVVGFTPSNPNGGNVTTALNAAANWLAYSFSPEANKTVNKIRVFASAVGGTLAASDLTCDIYTDVAGVPGASLSSTATVTATPTGAAWVEFTGLTQAVTGGTQYWSVLKNLNGTPGTNFPTYLHGASNTGSSSSFAQGSMLWGRNKVATVNSGVAWATSVRNNTFGWRIDFSDGTFLGEPCQGVGQAAGASAAVYLTRETGVVFVSPGGASLNVRGIAMCMAKALSPAGNLRFQIYSGTTLLATTLSIPAANVPTSPFWMQAYFSANQVIAPGTTVRVTAGTTSGGDVSNSYQSSEYTLNNDANSKALFPFGTLANPTNVAKKTYFDGSTWTDTDTALLPFALILDSDGEFGAAGSHFIGG